MTYKNLALTMVLGGLWHGAAWTFVIWGAFHGMLLALQRLLTPLLERISLVESAACQRIWVWAKIIIFFHLVCLGWLIFRSQSMTQVFQMLQALFCNFQLVSGIGLRFMGQRIVFLLAMLVILQIIQYKKNDLMIIFKWPVPILASVQGMMFYLMMLYASPGYKFIYFQF
jgi:D-alanyl-lipoteichoic acid acyltransferase DltB (MBOAT superfamily)